MQPLARTLANVRRFERQVDFRRGMLFDGQKLQAFVLTIKNNGGTLQHAFSADSTTASYDHLAAYADRINGRPPDGAFVTTPTVSPSVAHAGGGGVVSGSQQLFSFDTAQQSAANSICWADVIYYDGNTANRPRAFAWIGFRDIKGVSRYRLELYITIGITSSSWIITAANIPSGKKIDIRVVAALR